MKRFKEFLAEIFLLEGKIDDLKAQNPSLHREIDAYADADPSPTKKFVPWLVSQHKSGNVTPDHPDLHAVLGNYDRYRNIHGIKDHASKTFQEIHSAIMPLIGTGSTKAEIADQGHVKIHDSGDVQAYHVANKEASQKFYGGGPEAGPTNTRWCVSARSDRCLYEKSPYGKMYTIHVKGDPDSPYAVHPGHEDKKTGSITNRHNKGDKEIDDELKSNPKIARLKPAIDVIRKHYFNPEQKHYEKLKTDINNPDYKIALKALNHPMADSNIINMGVSHYDPRVAFPALHHRKADKETILKASLHEHPYVVLDALHKLKYHITDEDLVGEVLDNAAAHNDPIAAQAAINHSQADEFTLHSAIRNQNEKIALMAVDNQNIDKSHVEAALRHTNPQVRTKAQQLMSKFR